MRDVMLVFQWLFLALQLPRKSPLPVHSTILRFHEQGPGTSLSLHLPYSQFLQHQGQQDLWSCISLIIVIIWDIIIIIIIVISLCLSIILLHRYLSDVDSTCTMTMEEALCTSSLSRLNIANYLLKPSTIYGFAPSNTSIHILREHGHSAVVAVDSKYRCIGQYPGSSFAEGGQSGNQLFVDYCQWDDDQTFPPSPTFSNGVCYNAVVDVEYKIEYNNTAVLQIIASYRFADIPLQTADVLLYTHMTVQPTLSTTTLSPNTTSNTTNNNVTSTPQPQQLQQANYTTTPRPTVFSTRYRAEFISAGFIDEGPIRYSGKPGIL